jgi:hypothetical protein
MQNGRRGVKRTTNRFGAAPSAVRKTSGAQAAAAKRIENPHSAAISIFLDSGINRTAGRDLADSYGPLTAQRSNELLHRMTGSHRI